jgi:hypothetical protein
MVCKYIGIANQRVLGRESDRCIMREHELSMIQKSKYLIVDKIRAKKLLIPIW